MNISRLLSKSYCLVAVHFVLVLILTAGAYGEDSSEASRPNTNGRPVFWVAGKIVVIPEGVKQSPKVFKGSLGARPFALIKIEGKNVGEIYVAPLKGSTVDEANGMAASADKSEKIELLERTSFKEKDQTIEVVTLKMTTDSNFGSPWILHSFYFPYGENATTFKLAAPANQFKALLPYLETMLSLKRQDSVDAENTAQTDNGEESPQRTALRTMANLIEKGEYDDFYLKCLHPEVHQQVTQEKFTEIMKSPKGKLMIALFADIIGGLDSAEIREEVRPGYTFEFIHESKRKLPRAERKGPCVIGLKLYQGTWKFREFD